MNVKLCREGQWWGSGVDKFRKIRFDKKLTKINFCIEIG